MKEFFSKITNSIGGFAQSAGVFLKGYKRYIGWGLLAISHVVPEYTAVGKSVRFINDNLVSIQVGLDVMSGLFIAKAAREDYVSKKLPSGLSEEMKEEGKL